MTGARGGAATLVAMAVSYIEILLRDGSAATSYPLFEATTVFGCAVDADVRIRKSGVLDLHAEVVVQPNGQCLLRTHGPLNVNDTPSSAGSEPTTVPLKGGEVISIAGRAFRFVGTSL